MVLYKEEVPQAAALIDLYQALGWAEALGLSAEAIHKGVAASWYIVCAYNESGQLIGMGRVVSDGVLNAYICGLGVLPQWQKQGTASQILSRLTQRCSAAGMAPQLIAEAQNLPYYTRRGFVPFGAGLRHQKESK